MIHPQIRAALLTFEQVLSLVGKNTDFELVEDQYAIRPGLLLEKDPFPGLVLATPQIDFEGGLEGTGAGFGTATLEVRAISLVVDVSWDLMKAVCWNGGDPDDRTRRLSGLDGYRNITGNGLQSIKLQGTTETTFEAADKSGRVITVVQGTFNVEFDVTSVAGV
jgi:hypothetical protein